MVQDIKFNGIEDRDPPEYHLAILNQRIREMMNIVVRPFDLKLVEWRILQSLYQLETLTINELSEMAVIERTVTSRIVDRLANRELVRKNVLPQDRRAMQVVLTSQGKQLVSACDKEVSEARRHLFSGMEQADLVKFNAMLVLMQQNAVTAYRLAGKSQVSEHFSRTKDQVDD